MPVAVLSALGEEISLLIESLQRPAKDQMAVWPTWTGRFVETEVVLAAAGPGKVNTAALASIIWARHQPSVFIFSGVAGALDPSLEIGDLVIGERTIQHDAGVIGPEGFERYQAGHIPFYNPTDELGFASTDRLLELVRSVSGHAHLTPVLDRDPTIRFGTILTGDQFLHDGPTRDRLHTELSALAIEMEGAALGQAAASLGADHIVIRSISDRAGADAIVDFDRFLPEAAANSARLVLALVSRFEDHHRDLTVGA